MDTTTKQMRVWLATPSARANACVEALPWLAQNPFLNTDSVDAQTAIRDFTTATTPTANAVQAHGNDTFGARERHLLAHPPRMVGV